MKQLLIATLLTSLTALWSAEVPELIPLKEAAVEGAPLLAHHSDALVAWNRLTLVSAYQDMLPADSAANADVLTLLDHWALFFSAQNGDKTMAELGVLIDGLDPTLKQNGLVQYCIGKTYESLNRKKEARKAYQTAAKRMADEQAPAIRRTFATLRLIEEQVRKKKMHKETNKELVTNLAQHFYQALENNEFAGNERIFVSLFLDTTIRHKDSQELFHNTLAQLLEEKHGETWYGLTILGAISIDRAWAARGSGYAHTVTEAGWKNFHQHLAIAEQQFSQAWELAPQQHFAASEMVAVAMGANTQLNERQWFDRSVAACFDNQAVYRSYQWALRPRWGGSHRKMLRFGLECAETERYDTTVPHQLIDTVFAVYGELNGNEAHAQRVLFSDEALWEAVAAVCEGYRSADHSAESNAYYKNMQAALAWKFGKHTLAQQLAAEIGKDKVNDDILRSLKLDKRQLFPIQIETLEDF